MRDEATQRRVEKAGFAIPTDQFQRRTLLDMGVYGIHRATGVLGPARRVSAFSGITSPKRVARGGAFDGLEIDVTADDNTLLLLDFGNATFASIDATFSVVASRSPQMEIYGSVGTIIVNAPGTEPPVEIFHLDAVGGVSGWISPTQVGFPVPGDRTKQIMRGVLVEHLLDCLETGTASVLSAEYARHVLEVMLTAQQPATTGTVVELRTTFSMPRPVWSGHQR